MEQPTSTQTKQTIRGPLPKPEAVKPPRVHPLLRLPLAIYNWIFRFLVLGMAGDLVMLLLAQGFTNFGQEALKQVSALIGLFHAYPVQCVGGLVIFIGMYVVSLVAKWEADREDKAALRDSIRRAGAGQGSPKIHLVRVRDLKRQSFKLGDDAAADFPYIREPVEAAYTTTIQALRDASAQDDATRKRGVVVLGLASSGKTRLALEALVETLPEWCALRWGRGRTLAELPGSHELAQTDLVVLLDDLQDYAPLATHALEALTLTAGADSDAATLRTMLETVRQAARRVAVVATCRSEDEEVARAVLGWLFAELAIVSLPQFKDDAHDPQAARIISQFRAQGATHTSDWDGTLGSLVLGLSAKQSEYLAFQGKPAGAVMRAMKLLTLCRITEFTEPRIRGTCADVFGEPSIRDKQETWEEAVDELTRRQFVTEGITSDGKFSILSIRNDAYLDKVVTDYPAIDRPHELELHQIRLRDTLFGLRDVRGLDSLGTMWHDRGAYAQALTACDAMLTLDPNNCRAWALKADMLRHLKRREAEALAAVDRALELCQGDDAEAWYWAMQGTILQDLERYEEALAAYEQALARPSTYTAVWYATYWRLKGDVLSKLKRYDEALAAYQRALSFTANTDGTADAWFNIGIVLERLKRYDEALDAYERALALPSAHEASWYAFPWRGKGTALLNLGRYEEALAAYQHAVSLDANDAASWRNMGITLRRLGHIEQALSMYERALTRSHLINPAGARGGCSRVGRSQGS